MYENEYLKELIPSITLIQTSISFEELHRYHCKSERVELTLLSVLILSKILHVWKRVEKAGKRRREDVGTLK